MSKSDKNRLLNSFWRLRWVIKSTGARIGWGIELSPQIRDTIPAVIETVKTEIVNMNSLNANQVSLPETRFQYIEDPADRTVKRERRDYL